MSAYFILVDKRIDKFWRIHRDADLEILHALAVQADLIIDAPADVGCGEGEPSRAADKSSGAAPQPFDENIVHETTASVHRNRDACSLEPASEGGAGELRALVGVEYFRRAVPRERFVERRDAKARIHRVRQAPRQNRPAGPVDNRHKIQKAKRHRNIADAAVS